MRLKTSTYLQLSFMMFLEYAIWSVWYVTLGNYLTSIGFQGTEVGKAYSTLAWASIGSAFFVSLIADRYFAAQKLNGFLHLIAGLIMFWVSRIQNPDLFFWVLLLYMMFYMPTIALSNAIAFRHTPEAGKQFPRIRVLGTIGWIVAGVFISVANIELGPWPMIIAAVLSLLLGIYSFTLPDTPPKASPGKATIKDILGFDALKMMKDRSYAILIIATLMISIPFAMYHQFANMSMNEAGLTNVAGIQTLGQASEVIFMILMPFFFIRLGIKRMALMGMFAWAIRYFLFAYGNNAELVSFFYIGILLHGVCFDFFYVTAQIYVDKKAPADMRASLQGFLTFITYGVGWLLGTNMSGWLLQKYQIVDEAGLVVNHHWNKAMIYPAMIALVVAIAFLFLFKQEKEKIEMEKTGIL
jgi:nucleoside transporter